MNSSLTFLLSRTVRIAAVRNYFDLPPLEKPDDKKVLAAKKESQSKHAAFTPEGLQERMKKATKVMRLTRAKKMPAISDFIEGQQRRQASQLHRQEVRDQANDYLQQLKLVREGKLKIQRPGKEEEA